METDFPYIYILELHVVSKNPNNKYILDADCLQGTWPAEQYLLLTESANHIIEFIDGVLEVQPWYSNEDEDCEVRS